MSYNRHMKRVFFGFTLIELMVVIAIVAVLAAISVPAYKVYKNKAEVASAIPTISAIVQDSIEYYARNGVFPSATELNLPTPNMTSYVLPPNIVTYFVNPQISTGAPECNYSSIGFYISGYDGNFFTDPDNAKTTLVLYNPIDVNGTMEVLCTVGEFDNGVSPTLTGNNLYPGNGCTLETNNSNFGEAAIAYATSACP